MCLNRRVAFQLMRILRCARSRLNCRAQRPVAFLPDGFRGGEDGDRGWRGTGGCFGDERWSDRHRRWHRNSASVRPARRAEGFVGTGGQGRFITSPSRAILAAIEKSGIRVPPVLPAGHATRHGIGPPRGGREPAATVGGYSGVSSRGERRRSGNEARRDGLQLTSRVQRFYIFVDTRLATACQLLRTPTFCEPSPARRVKPSSNITIREFSQQTWYIFTVSKTVNQCCAL